MITRRGLITGLATLLAAPAIVRAGSLMPVKAWAETYEFTGIDLGNGDRTVRWVVVGERSSEYEYYTLSGALDDSKPGDTIIVTPGIYDANGIRVNKLTAIY